MLRFEHIMAIIGSYVLMIFFSLLGFFGGMFLGIGELASVALAIIIITIAFIVPLIQTIRYIKIYKIRKNVYINILRFSLLIFIMAIFFGFSYKTVEMDGIEGYLANIGNIVNEYRITNNIEYLSEDDFEKMNLPKAITVELFEDGYILSYRYGHYYGSYEHEEGRVRVRRD